MNGHTRPMDVDRSGEAWVYRPSSHKTEHHGGERIIVNGPKAREVLAPWLDHEPSAYRFCPAEHFPTRPSRRPEASH